MPYLFCELDEMTSLYHDVPWEVLTYDNVTSSKSFGLLKYRRPVLHYINFTTLHCSNSQYCADIQISLYRELLERDNDGLDSFSILLG